MNDTGPRSPKPSDASEKKEVEQLMIKKRQEDINSSGNI